MRTGSACFGAPIAAASTWVRKPRCMAVMLIEPLQHAYSCVLHCWMVPQQPGYQQHKDQPVGAVRLCKPQRCITCDGRGLLRSAGLRMRRPTSLLAGLMWFDPDRPDALDNIRHDAQERDGAHEQWERLDRRACPLEPHVRAVKSAPEMSSHQ